jgi:predicted enzyme related to lactoylglutathione lyase
MGQKQSAQGYTRRTALLLAGAAMPLRAQSKGTNSPGGKMGRPVVHFEIGCTDVARTQKFFSALFDWNIQGAGPAAIIDTGSGQGVQGHITALGHEPQHYTTFYVEVDDIQAYLDKAVSLGGKTLVPPVKIPTGTFAWLSDPDGNIIGLLKPKA